jgi:hypothetical protein
MQFIREAEKVARAFISEINEETRLTLVRDVENVRHHLEMIFRGRAGVFHCSYDYVSTDSQFARQMLASSLSDLIQPT